MQLRQWVLTITLLIYICVPTFGQQEMVRMVYFYGKDRTILEIDVNTKMTLLANELLKIYSGLIFEKENNAFKVHFVEGKRNASDYIAGQGLFNLLPAEPSEEILDEIREEKNFDMSKDLYFVVANVNNPGQECGEGGIVVNQDFGDRFWSGKQAFDGAWALIYESETCVDELSVYFAAHELGHAFGLLHDFSDPSHIMSYGTAGVDDGSGNIKWTIPDKLSDCATEWLKASRFFNPNYNANAQQGTLTVSSNIYYQNTNELHLTLTGTGVNETHQIQLHVVPTTIPPGFMPKDPDRDSKWTDFESKHSVHSCHTFTQSQSDKSQILFKDVVLSKSPPNNEIKLHLIDTNGNIIRGSVSTESIGFKDAVIIDTDTLQTPPTTTGVSQEGRLLATLRGHTEFVTSVAFSPDGRTLATGSRDDTIRLWNPRTAEHVETLIGHVNDVTSIAFHPTGEELASGSWDTSIGIWNLRSRKLKKSYFKKGGFITSVAYLPISGEKLAWGSVDNHVRVSLKGSKFPNYNNSETGHLHAKKPGTIIWEIHSRSHGHDVSSVIFSPDEKTLASGSWDNTIKLWTADPHFVMTLRGHSDFVTSIAFSPNGKILASGSWDNTIKLWDMTKHEVILTLTGHTDRVLTVAFSPDGRTLVSGSDDHTIRLWDVATGRQKDTLIGHTSGVTAVAFSPDRRTLASTGGWDNTVRVWDLSPTPTPIPTVTITPTPVVSPDIGENLVIKLHISGVNDVAGYQATVGYDSTALRYVESAIGSYMPVGSLFVPPIINSNQITIAVTSLTEDSDGAGILATLTFEVLSVKPSNITLTDVMVMERDLTSIPIIVKGGNVVAKSSAALDVNGDGVVNVTDLVIVATHFGTTGSNQADVNNDNIVDIRDLLLVASGLNAGASAPFAFTQETSTLNASDIQGWLSQAQQFNLIDADYQRGIVNLQQLLIALTPKETALLPNYPNPFNPETWIPYQLAKPSDVTLSFYSADGKLIRMLELGHKPVGIYEHRSKAAYWDGKNEFGEPVASGVYFYTLNAGDFTATRKMLIRK